jgi:catechol 2,3-dioxygenase
MHSGIEAGSTSAPTYESIAPETSVGTVRLTVSDLARSTHFYEHVLGLVATEGENGSVSLSAGGPLVLVELHGVGSARPLDPRSPGLYHLAILTPDRRELAIALARLGSAGWPLTGASDHLVSEALYLSDPDGNGIEIYRDRPREEWTERDGTLAMATLPLDLRDLLAELDGATEVDALAPEETRMGHVHLQVSGLAQAESFYAGVLGFDVMVRSYPGALFVSAGGYHHHIGLNTWQSAGAGRREPGAMGLRSFDVLLPTPDELKAVMTRLHRAGIDAQAADGGFLVEDPFGNGVLLRAA